MKNLTEQERQQGTEKFIKHLEELREENPEIGDFHEAFEFYCANKYSLGNSANTAITNGSKDIGIDFYSVRDKEYLVAQCKIPAADWLEANPGKCREFGPQSVDDPRDALRYLTGDSQLVPNDRVRRLYTLVEGDRNHEDFSLTFFLIVYGRLNKRASESFEELKQVYKDKNINLVLQQIDDLVDEFLVGSAHATGEIQLDISIPNGDILRAKDYCYFLANAADLCRAFQKYGWRLFDLNLRYEIRNSPVNGEIIDSLKYSKSRKRFHHFNNGLIVVVKAYSSPNDNQKIRLNGAQIVNGLQTVKSIYDAVSLKEVDIDELDKECLVQVKVIKAADEDLTSKIVRSTNNQNPMSPRNLKANSREQKILKGDFASLTPRWFLQVKEGEWESLTSEGGHFFKQVTKFAVIDFKPDARKKHGRVIDNQVAAKAWLAMIGFADQAGGQVSHYFTTDLYNIAFTMRPTKEHWRKFAEATDFDSGRRESLEGQQGSASQYLLAFLLWEFTKYFIPKPKSFRDEALQEGVKAGKILKVNGQIKNSDQDQNAYLNDNVTYQTWRMMSNMKELMVEMASHILVRRYGPLEPSRCIQLLQYFDVEKFLITADIAEVAQNAARATDLPKEAVFSRIFGLLRYAAGQLWEEKGASLSKLRSSSLLTRKMAADFKIKIWEINARKNLDKSWKPEGKTFLESLLDLDSQRNFNLTS